MTDIGHQSILGTILIGGNSLIGNQSDREPNGTSLIGNQSDRDQKGTSLIGNQSDRTTV